MLAAAALVAAAVGVGIFLFGGSGDTRSTTAPRATSTSSSATGPEQPTTADPAAPTTVPPAAGTASGDERPVRLTVPAIGVDAPVILLGLDADDKLEVPATARDAGWWSGGSVPGTPGPAVIAGHVNLSGAQGVFAELGELDPGDEVSVSLDAGREVRYRIDRVESHAKDAFPTKAVYGPTPRPELRLITCSGSFNAETGHYLDNTIAFGTLMS